MTTKNTTTDADAVETIKGGEYYATITEGFGLSFGAKVGSTAIYTVRIFHRDAKPGEPAATVADRSRRIDARRFAKAYLARYDAHLERTGVRFEVAARAQKEAEKRDRRVRSICAGLGDFTVGELDRIISAAIGEKMKKNG